MRHITILISFLCLSITSISQTKFAINYIVGVPVSETSDIIDKTSWRGVNLDFSYFLKEELTIGLSGGWQVFDDNRGYITETTGTETISGYRYNYLNSFPIYATAGYYFHKERAAPYVSLGIGVVYNELEEDIGLIQYREEEWQFSLKPEIGLDYEISYGLAVRASFKYYFVAEANDLPNLSYLGIGLGLVWSK